MSIVADSEFNQYLVLAGLTVGSTDRSLLLNSAEAAVESLCRRRFSLQSCGETIEIKPHETARYSIKTKSYPIIASSLILTDTSTLVPNTSLIIEESTGVIKLRNDGSYFNTGRDAVLITYQAGFTEANAPKDLTRLICSTGILLWSHPEGAAQSEKIGDYSYKLSNTQIEQGLDAINMNVLNKYRKLF